MAYTAIDDPSAYFQVKTYDGTGSSLALTFDGNSDMQPDWVWLKRRDGSANHHAYTSITGVTAALVPNDTDVETTGSLEATNYFSSFNSDGFTLAGGNYNNSNKSGQTYASWSWKAGGASGSSNSDGSITSSVSANTTAGFSTVLWTHDGGNSTIGHGLGAIPSVIITKERNATGSWNSYFSAVGNAHRMILQDENAKISSSVWNSTTPTSSVFSMNESNTSTFIAYCFCEKKGYSKFGGYEGNGSTNGTYVYLGFQPALVIIRKTSGTGDWEMLDNQRLGYNPRNETLGANYAGGEGNYNRIDILSNGFKVRSSSGNVNSDGGDYIYLAFAQNPLVTSTGVPGLAR